MEQQHSAYKLASRPNSRADRLAPRAFLAARVHPAQHVVRDLAAIRAGVFRHVGRLGVQRQKAALAAGRGAAAARPRGLTTPPGHPTRPPDHATMPPERSTTWLNDLGRG